MINKENREVENYDEDIQELINKTKCRFMDPVIGLQKRTDSEIVKRKLDTVCIWDIENIAKNWDDYIYAHEEQISKVYYAKEKGLVVAIADNDVMVYGERLQILFSIRDMAMMLANSYLSRCMSVGIKDYAIEAVGDEIVKYIIEVLGELE